MERNERLAYIAGLIDGEGCITINNRLKTCTSSYILSLIISMYDPEPISMSASTLNCKVHTSFPKKCSTTHYIKLNGKKAADALKQVLPYLQAKRNEAELAISYMDTITDYCGTPVPEQERLIRLGFYDAMQRLIKSHKGW